MVEPHHRGNPASASGGDEKNLQQRDTSSNQQRPRPNALSWPVGALDPPHIRLAALLILFLALQVGLFSFFLSPSSHCPSSLPQYKHPSYNSTVPSILQVLPDSASHPVTMSNENERTFIAIKPDGVQRGLIGPIISRFENKGFKLVAIKVMVADRDHLETHYHDLKGKGFFPPLIEYMGSGPICAMVWEGLNVVKTGRVMLGTTNPLDSAPGTIRGDYAIEVGRNICHGSDSVESANKEIALWFPNEKDLADWNPDQNKWIYEPKKKD